LGAGEQTKTARALFELGHTASVPTIEPLTRRDLPASVDVLALAFRDNPAMVAMFPGASEDERLRALGTCMDGFVASVLRYGVAEGVKDGGRVTAVSLSFRPGTFPPPFLATLMQAKGPLRAGPRAALRFARLDREMHARHARYPHWYLWFLGVDPQRQGQGLGSLLLRSLSSKAEADGTACYLEADILRNVRLYERHGYRVESEETLPASGVRFWFMKRPPAG
jgi:GNAT superfamily N-acetyltransferase